MKDEEYVVEGSKATLKLVRRWLKGGTETANQAATRFVHQGGNKENLETLIVFMQKVNKEVMG